MLSCLGRIPLCATPWTVARQAPLSLGFSRQEYWSGLPRSSPGDLPQPGIEPTSLLPPALLVDSALCYQEVSVQPCGPCLAPTSSGKNTPLASGAPSGSRGPANWTCLSGSRSP